MCWLNFQRVENFQELECTVSRVALEYESEQSPLSKKTQVRVTQPLVNSCTLKNHNRRSLICIPIVVIFTCVILMKVWRYFLLFIHSYLALIVVYYTLLRFNLKVNTFRTHIIIYSHFYLVFFCYVLTYLRPFFPSTSLILVAFW